jgi:hypothetical protein
VSEAAVPQAKGANITQEALSLVVGVIARPPKSMTPKAWYSAIAPQLLVMLDGNEGPDLVRAAAYIIGYGVLGKEDSGAPGMDAWPVLICNLN